MCEQPWCIEVGVVVSFLQSYKVCSRTITVMCVCEATVVRLQHEARHIARRRANLQRHCHPAGPFGPLDFEWLRVVFAR